MYSRFYYFGVKTPKDKYLYVHKGFKITFSYLKALLIAFEIECNVTVIAYTYTSKNNDL